MDKNSKGIYKGPDTPPSVKKGKNHVLAIAIDDYTHCQKLNNAVKDAKDFINLLTEKYGFEEDNIEFLSNEEATAEQVIDALKRLTRHVKPTDNVLIYFSGHGELDKDFDEGFWIPVEAQSGQRNQYISNDTINRALQRINSFHTFLIVDSCYSGSLFLDGKSKSLSESYDFPSRWGLTSGRNTLVSDGVAGKNSPFATALLDVLRRIDKPLNVSALCDLIKQTVPAATNKLQIPIGDPLSINGHKGGQFVFEPIATISPEVAEWTAAKAENTEAAYSRYLRKYKHGQFAQEAEDALELLEQEREQAEEIAFWQDTTVKNSLLAYHRYLRKYPNGHYADEADARLDALENQELRKKQEQVEAEKVRKAQIAQQEAEKKERERQEKARLAELEIERKKQAEAAEKERQKQALLARIEPEMLFVKGGTFKMGSNDDGPIHSVTLSDFSIGKYPITQKQWQEIMGNNPSDFKGETLPVENVSWDDCQEFIKKLNEKTGKKYRLPTEAEWEFAARGGNQSKGFEYSGSNNIDEVAWYYNNSDNKTHPIGTKKANELGIHDMSGNVWEWCNDWYDSYRNAIENNPKGADTGSHRVSRGGSWFNGAELCRVTCRNYDSPTIRDSNMGFRLVSSFQ